MDEFLNKKIKVVYDDGSHVTIKIGIVTSKDESFLYLGNDAISLSRIIRAEVIE